MSDFGRPRKKKVYRAIRRLLEAEHGLDVAASLLSRMSLYPDGDDGWAFWFALNEEDAGYGDVDGNGDIGTSYVVFDDRVRDPKEPHRPGISIQLYGIGDAVLAAAYAANGKVVDV